MSRLFERQQPDTPALVDRSDDPTVVPGENGWMTASRFMLRERLADFDFALAELHRFGVVEACYLRGSEQLYPVVRVLQPDRWEAAKALSIVLNKSVLAVLEEGLLPP